MSILMVGKGESCSDDLRKSGNYYDVAILSLEHRGRK